MVLERHEVAQWKAVSPADVQLEMSVAEQAGFTHERDITVAGESENRELAPTTVAAETSAETKKEQPPVKEVDRQPEYDSLKAIGYLMFNLKPLTGLLISFLNGFIVAGKPISISLRCSMGTECCQIEDTRCLYGDISSRC